MQVLKFSTLACYNHESNEGERSAWYSVLDLDTLQRQGSSWLFPCRTMVTVMAGQGGLAHSPGWTVILEDAFF